MDTSGDAPIRVLDSHIHLWPASDTIPESHSWMTPGMPLAKQYSLENYFVASGASRPSARSTTTSTSPVVGAVYIETDRTLGHWPDSSSTSSGGELDVDALLARCAQPLAELRWLRRLVEGTPAAGADEGFAPGDGEMLLGLVPWAPVDAGADGMRAYLREAEQTVGPTAWARVRGVRFLLQSLESEEALQTLVESEAWVEGLKECGRRGLCFDVGVDVRGKGVWQLEQAVEMMERVNEGVPEGETVRFVLNHLCKPDLEQLPTTPAQLDTFERWTRSLQRAARSPHVYMKLSGAFSELPPQPSDAPWPAAAVVERMCPWLDVLFATFRPARIMFGSDWPVCNVRGPGDARAWPCWRDVVVEMLSVYGLDAEARDRVWFRTAVEAYWSIPSEGEGVSEQAELGK
ncbi:uncharacterized protein K452DRAFT_274763 [Aplosporella prunicola CBS 121167]|uniref:Amidohydrolase-related domain-containing protein n=1 Tax=Aplosporella prunicola CBS 121167 TaxID=1176127 RepID=A0A6A6B926_9PEZI|nr:uncharacterized protein K452DRAFT_274763 [Aplosporella prunicola CBS 121167]KAF2140078.1 hypothetical protein K452DRAFT_274763 [Aplosporella prunicola CBS 121167]